MQNVITFFFTFFCPSGQIRMSFTQTIVVICSSKNDSFITKPVYNHVKSELVILRFGFGFFLFTLTFIRYYSVHRNDYLGVAFHDRTHNIPHYPCYPKRDSTSLLSYTIFRSRMVRLHTSSYTQRGTHFSTHENTFQSLSRFIRYYYVDITQHRVSQNYRVNEYLIFLVLALSEQTTVLFYDYYSYTRFIVIIYLIAINAYTFYDNNCVLTFTQKPGFRYY